MRLQWEHMTGYEGNLIRLDDHTVLYQLLQLGGKWTHLVIRGRQIKESQDLPNESLKATTKNADNSTEVAGSVDNPSVIDCSSDGLMSVENSIGNQKRKSASELDPAIYSFRRFEEKSRTLAPKKIAE